MAVLLPVTSGNFTSSSTWGVGDTTSLLDSEASSVAISTSNIDSATFTPGAITVDGIAVKLSARAASPTGTLTITLRNSTGSADVTSVTVNISDIPASGNGWFFVKFSASQTLLAATLYLVRVVCSNTGSQVTLFRNATANNISRILRTTTTAAPSANDQLVICGEHTGAGTGNSLTVTMDNTATTTWGPSTVGTQGVMISKRGTLTFGTSSSTAYYFRWRGIFMVCGDGVLNVGSSGTRIPASSSVTLEMSCANNADSSLLRAPGGVITMYAADKTIRTYLSADKIATNTVITFLTGGTTGWQASDALAFAPTNSAAHFETKNISTVDSSTQVTLSAGLTNPHISTLIDTIQFGRVVNLTRNIKLQSASTSLRGNMLIQAGGTGAVYIEGMELVASTLGTNSTNQRMVDIQSTTNACTLKNCSLNAGSAGAGNNNMGIYISGSASDNFTIDGLVSYNYNRPCITLSAGTTGTAWVIQNCVCIKQTELNGGFEIRSTLGIVKNNEAYACLSGFYYSEGTSGAGWTMLDATRYDGNIGMFCTSAHEIFSGNGGSVRFNAQNCQGVRNSSSMFQFSDGLLGGCFTSCEAMGNATSTDQAADYHLRRGGWITLINCTGSGDTTFGANQCFVSNDANNGYPIRAFLYNCSLGVVSGIRTAYVNGVGYLKYPTQQTIQITAQSCVFGNSDTAIITNRTNVAQQEVGDHINLAGSFLRSQRHNQTNATHKTYVPQGIISYDAVIVNVDPASERLTPNTASYKLRSAPLDIAVLSGSTRVVSVYVRKSVSGDAGGANYNGNQPRLMLRQNNAIGVTADTVLATASGSAGSFELLTATVPTAGSASDQGGFEVYVDCDGTAGWVNVTDWVANALA